MRKRISPARCGRSRIGPAKPKVVAKIRRTKTQAYTEDWSSITAKIRARDGQACRLCRSTNSLQVHHLIPVSRGGLTINSNLMTLCIKCHERKH
jgi:5-methylcytosine-specific restriction endonuclease McrA